MLNIILVGANFSGLADCRQKFMEAVDVDHHLGVNFSALADCRQKFMEAVDVDHHLGWCKFLWACRL